ncbi:MAG: hypothetical protein HFE90_01795 [Firmicutes bacterium]|nr:hypothetical protein [Bacillota bacterium]
MFGRKNRKKGSAAVLLVIFFISVVAAISVIYEASERKAALSISELVFDMAGRTVLSCYDRALQQDYGIFAFECDDESLESRLKALAEGSLSRTSVPGCEVEETSVEKTAFSLFESKNFKFQIIEMMKKNKLNYDDMDCGAELREINRGFVKYKNAVRKAEELEEDAEEEMNRREELLAKNYKEDIKNADESAAKSVNNKFEELQDMHKRMKQFMENCQNNEIEEKDRILRNRKVMAVLPSKEAGIALNQAFSGEKETGIFKAAVDMENGNAEAVFIDEYIMKHFGHHMKTGDKDTFFSNEVEYILYGGNSDLENYKKAYRAASAFRMSANISYIFNNSNKLEEISKAAFTLGSDFFQPYTEQLMALAWAAGETVNDMDNLKEGNCVPFIKTEDCWVTDLESVIAGIRGEYKEISSVDSGKYEDYLRLLLSTLDMDTKIYRIMDLIQINLKGRERQEFLISDHYTGFSVKAVIKKKSRSAAVPSGRSRISVTHVYNQQRIN